ncbi:MAG TPA: phosphate ABC transporter substrate-binding protein PstS [Solirubrobacteraceae bacterium]|nr:phosphate ABC transporter substrate-binding protein PstS [Solirubrobacteraceae bacterium]
MRSKRLASLACAGLLAGCVFAISAAAASAATLNGAGSTLVAPIEAEWAASWSNATGNTVNYAAVGSGSGEKDIAGGLVDFGASDAPLSVYSGVPGNLVQIPWALTATGVSYHINGLRLPRGTNLHLSGPVLAQIYLGQITNWDSPAIKKLNKGASIPSTPITTFVRSDSSGDTYAFTRYLSDVSGPFNSQVGSSTTVSFPKGVGEKGNSGMATALAGANGGIAYIAVSYLIAQHLPALGIRNAAGRYVVPNLSAIEAAASVVHHVPAGNQVTIVNPPKRAKSAYPISTFTYAIVPTNAPQGDLLKSFFGYAIGAGQRFGPSLDFAPLPKVVLAAARGTINGIS